MYIERTKRIRYLIDVFIQNIPQEPFIWTWADIGMVIDIKTC